METEANKKYNTANEPACKVRHPTNPPSGKPKDSPKLLVRESTLDAAVPAPVVDAEVNRKRARWSKDLKYIAPNKKRFKEPIQKQRTVIRPEKPSAYTNREQLPETNVYTPVRHYDAELEGTPDAVEGIDVLFKTIGKSIYRERCQLDPRSADGIITFNAVTHTKELSDNLRWDDCPDEYKAM